VTVNLSLSSYYKRSVYSPLPRDMVPEALSLFDLPNPNLVGAHREETTSPSQALFLMNNAFVQDEALHFARQLLEKRKLSRTERIRRAYLEIFQRQPNSAEIKRGASFIKEETRLLAAMAPPQVEDRSSTPELDSSAAVPAPTPYIPASDPPAPMAVTSPIVAAAATAPAEASPGGTNSAVAAAEAAGNFGGGGFRGGFRGPRTFKGPGSANDTVVGKLAPGVARPKVFHQALPEKPATPEEGALALFAQALLGSSEFRYLQ